MTSGSFSKSAIVYLTVAAATMTATLAKIEAHTPEKLTHPATPGIRRAPDFVLIDQDNHRFESAQLRGKVAVLTFIFTSCTDVCPIFTANLATLQRKLNPRYAAQLYFISVTTDPEVDSAKVLKAYAQRYRADLKNWAFLTGSEAQLRQVWNGFSVRVIRKGRGLVQHTSLTTIIDRDGSRRHDYFGEKWSANDLERDLLTLLDKKA